MPVSPVSVDVEVVAVESPDSLPEQPAGGAAVVKSMGIWKGVGAETVQRGAGDVYIQGSSVSALDSWKPTTR